MATKHFVRNNGSVKINLPLETAGNVVVRPGDQIEYSTKAVAEAVANDFNSALYQGTPVEVIEEVDEVRATEPEAEVKEEVTPNIPEDKPVFPVTNPVEPKNEVTFGSQDPNSALKNL